MHYLRHAVFCLFFFACVPVRAAPALEPFEVADRVAEAESPAWLVDYKQATKLFGKGRDEEKVAEAAAIYELIAYQGSIAAAIRLCVIYGHGVGHSVRPNTGTFWCDKALAAGYKGAAEIKLQLADKYWKPLDDVDFESFSGEKAADTATEQSTEQPAENASANSPNQSPESKPETSSETPAALPAPPDKAS